MIQVLKQAFQNEYGEAPSLVVRAPGRINLIGEHTDYNKGLVFPAGIDKSMYFAFRPNQSDNYNIYAYDKSGKVQMSKDNMVSDKLWARYCIAVIQEFVKLGIDVKGFDCLFMSDIPIGAGVSSSAALECGLAMGLDSLAGSGLGKWEMARIGNRAENSYLGIQSGILDQFASIFSKRDMAMLMDCATQEFEYHKVELGPYALVLINTNVKHSHLSSGYNDRPTECKTVLDVAQKTFDNVSSLSELNKDQLEAIKSQLSETLYGRALFIIEENQRVLAFKEALVQKDFMALGQLLYASHEGLKTLYEVSCVELDTLVDLSHQHDQIIGARMMGGGFGGCTLNLIAQDGKEEVIERICTAYHDQTGIQASTYIISIGEGVERC